MTDLITCNAVAARLCEGSPRERGDGVRMYHCYRCGLGVCGPCSSIQPAKVVVGARLRTRLVRMCDNCLEQEPNGEARVLLRRYHEAGYPTVTLEACETELAGGPAAYPRDTTHVPASTLALLGIG